MSTKHEFTEHDKTEQGQKAIAQGIKNKQAGVHPDYAESEGADFSWPDLDPDSIGSLEPWMCYRIQRDGSYGGWTDLNQFASGQKRKHYACFLILGFPEALGEDHDTAKAIVERLLESSDLETEAAEYGFTSNEHYTVADHVNSALLALENEQEKGFAAADALLKEQHAKLDAQMDEHIAAAAEGGLLDPISGVDMDTWAAANAKIANGVALEEVLAVVGVEKPVWDEVSAKWTERMSQDTTFAISKVYGDAFVNSNIGRFAEGAGDAKEAAPTGGSANAVQAVMDDFELYVKIMCHQNMGATQGKDAVSILSEYGLNAADWGSIGAHWTPKMATDTAMALQMSQLMEKYNAEFASAGVGDDIEF